MEFLRPPLPQGDTVTVEEVRKAHKVLKCVTCSQVGTYAFRCVENGEAAPACCIDHAIDWFGIYRRDAA